MKKAEAFVIGLDFGTSAVRASIVDAADGIEAASGVYSYPSGVDGCLLDRYDALVVRHDAKDYIQGIETSVAGAVAAALENKDAGFSIDKIAGIGVDTTSSTPIPVTRDGRPVSSLESFKENLNAHVWLWKDHSSFAEAEEITRVGKKTHPEYIDSVGGSYSSEWYWAKILRCRRIDKAVFDAAYTWVEAGDWLVFQLCGGADMLEVKRGIGAAGHKALFDMEWGGYPQKEFMASFEADLIKLYDTFNVSNVLSSKYAAGMLSNAWVKQLGFSKPVPVAVAGVDAHFGGVGAGVGIGVLVRAIGTSTCDLIITGKGTKKPLIPGMAGIVTDSLVPGYYGIEAGQAAVGDIFNWFVKYIQPQGKSIKDLSAEAEQLLPGESGLLSLDWHNGNRNILGDQQLTGLIAGLDLQTSPAEIYRALVEGTAFGARVILEQMEKCGIKVNEIVACGGIPKKDPLFMQIYADVFGKPFYLSRNSETCALGGAIAASVASGVHPDYETAMQKMCSRADVSYQPIPQNAAVYNELFLLYRDVHNAFGTEEAKGLFPVMKKLLSIKRQAKLSKKQ
ncbi:ribulokinase [Spirochaetia bacterium]|nr:ribulokinase [Spirochaetia bacterium]